MSRGWDGRLLVEAVGHEGIVRRVVEMAGTAFGNS